MKQISNPLIWLMLAFSLYFLGIGSVGLVGPDEPRYADVARGMKNSGDYITPRLFGLPWFEKPALYYWLAAQSLRSGANEIGARMPSALSACLLVFFFFIVSRNIFGIRIAGIASMLLGSTAGWIGFAHAATMDMLFSSTLTAAMILLGSWFWRRTERDLYWSFAALGLATLAKGPAAIVLAGAVALAYIVLFREWKTIPKLLASPALLAWALVALPWYVLCYKVNGYVFFQEFIVKHNFGRFTSTALGHGQPIWYFVPVLAAVFFPWSFLLLLPLLDLFRSGAQSLLRNRHRAFLFIWAGLTFVFFSLSKNKLPGYILPVLPPLALWIAIIIEGESAQPASGKAKEADEPDSEANPLQKMALWLIGGAAILLLLVPFVLPLVPQAVVSGVRQAAAGLAGHYWSRVIHGSLPPASLILIVAPMGLAVFKLLRRDLIEAFFFLLVTTALTMALLVEFIAPEINRVASVRSIAQKLDSLEIDGSQVAVAGLNRNQSLGLDFYLDRALPEWDEHKIPDNLEYVVAKDDVKIPDAQMVVLFPGQHLRLWALPRTRFEIQMEPPPGKSL